MSYTISDLGYTKEQQKTLTMIESDLKAHMFKKAPHRFKHSVSVAHTAEKLARIYGCDPYLAYIAGLLHDWYKVESKEKQIRHAQRLSIDLGCDFSFVFNLLHGLIAAKELPLKYPQFPDELWQAIARHTSASADMSALDMVVFVADAIEPLRPSHKRIRDVRDRVGKASLDALFWQTFLGGILYVLETERYLYPDTLKIYNELILKGYNKHL